VSGWHKAAGGREDPGLPEPTNEVIMDVIGKLRVTETSLRAMDDSFAAAVADALMFMALCYQQKLKTERLH
jgi:hypothetical protein